MLLTLIRLLLAGLASVSLPGGDELVRLDAQSLRIELPRGRSVALSGSGRMEMSEGRTVLVLPEGAFIAVNGQPVSAQAHADAGDTVVVRSEPGGDVLWELRVGDLTVAERDALSAYREAVAVAGGGAGGAFRGRAEPSRYVIGVTTAPPDEALAAQLGVASDRSLRVLDVSRGLPAQAAGVQAHDVIVAVDGHEVVTKQSLRELINARESGQPVHLTVLRRGQRVELAVPVAERADAELAQADAERRARELQAVELERALNDHERMYEALQDRLAMLEDERLHREMTLAELYARTEQREVRVAELQDRLSHMAAMAEDLAAAAEETKASHPKHQQLMADLHRLDAERDSAQARLHEELAGLSAVREDLAAVRAPLAAAEQQADQQRVELEQVRDAMAGLMDQRNALMSGLAFVESGEGAEALLMAESLAAYQRALAGDQRELAEQARLQAELRAQEHALHNELEVERAQLEAELMAREMQLELELTRERAALEAERVREQAELARREAELARELAQERVAMAREHEHERRAVAEAEAAHQAELAMREAALFREQAERQAAEAQQRAMQLADRQSAMQHEVAESLHGRLDELDQRLARIEELLARLLATQPN